MEYFSKLSGIDKAQVEKLYTTPGFEEYEKGLMEDAEFRDFVRKTFSVQSKDEEIDVCWNAMLLGLPIKKLNLLNELKNKYSVYLLSNTNNIHINHINKNMLPSVTRAGDKLENYFHRAYYSHIMKKRKPNADIFEQVLSENSLLAHETLFLDDNLPNIEGAKQVGIQTVHIAGPVEILSYFHEQ